MSHQIKLIPDHLSPPFPEEPIRGKLEATLICFWRLAHTRRGADQSCYSISPFYLADAEHQDTFSPAFTRIKQAEVKAAIFEALAVAN